MTAREPTVSVLLEPGWEQGSLVDDVRRGLGSQPRTLPPKWLYDDVGSRLFDEITALPAYYPTEAERAILRDHAADIAAASDATTLVELGSGTSDKTRLLLDALRATGRLERFVPVDVSEGTLREAATRLATAYPGLAVQALVGDFTLHLGHLPEGGRRMVAFLGGTIGNFYVEERGAFLGALADQLAPGDWLLLGTDLVKSADRLIAAYDDPGGVTARFVTNALARAQPRARRRLRPRRLLLRAVLGRPDAADGPPAPRRRPPARPGPRRRPRARPRDGRGDPGGDLHQVPARPGRRRAGRGRLRGRPAAGPTPPATTPSRWRGWADARLARRRAGPAPADRVSRRGRPRYVDAVLAAVDPARGRASLGLLQVVAAGVLWGTGGLVVTVLHERDGLGAMTASAWRMALAAVALVGFAAATSRLGAVRSTFRRHPPGSVLVGVGTATYQGLYFVSVLLVGVSVATVVALGLAPVLATVWEKAVGRRWPSAREVGVLAAALTGLVLISTTAEAGSHTAGDRPGLGVTLAVVAGATYAATTVLGHRLAQDADSVALTTCATLAGSVALLPFLAVAILRGEPVLTSGPATTGLLVYLGVGTMAVSYGLLYAGLRTTSGSAATVATLVEPLSAALLAALLLGERLTAPALVGGALILLAVLALHPSDEHPAPA